METGSRFINLINQRNANISFSTSANLVKSKRSSFTQGAMTTELYELFYWDKKWISLGRQYGKENRLAFYNIPQNALFRIHNHTRGKEHRPFTYEEGKQVWW